MVVGLLTFWVIALMVKLRLLLGIIIIEREKRKVKRKLCGEVHWFWFWFRFSSTVTERREYCQLIHFMVCFAFGKVRRGEQQVQEVIKIETFLDLWHHGLERCFVSFTNTLHLIRDHHLFVVTVFACPCT